MNRSNLKKILFSFFIPAILFMGCSSQNTTPFGLLIDENVNVVEQVGNLIIFGDQLVISPARFTNKWVLGNDRVNGGNSTNWRTILKKTNFSSDLLEEIAENGPWGNKLLATNAVQCNYRGGNNGYQPPYINFGVGETWNLNTSEDLNLDASKYDGFAFWMTGTPDTTVRVKVCTYGSFLGLESEVGDGSKYDWDFYGYTINILSSKWKKYVVRFDQLSRLGWSWWNPDIKLDLTHVTKFEWETDGLREKEEGWFAIFDLKLIEGIYER